VIDAGLAQPGVYYLLGSALLKLHRASEAVVALRSELQLQPNFPEALDQLAWTLATHPDPNARNGREAVEVAQRFVQVMRGNAASVDVLAAAYAEAGDFNQAIRLAQQAQSEAVSHGDTAHAGRIAQRIARYRAGQAWRDPG
jgi:cytochrome c-type biogenesis protein CcmH/NrfG